MCVMTLFRIVVLTALLASLPMLVHAADNSSPPIPRNGPVDATGTGPVTPPVALGSHDAEGFYPPASRIAGEEGNVIVNFIIQTDGSVRDVKVVRSSGIQRLDEAAVLAASTWRYRPAMQDGKPVAYRWNSQLVFKMRDSFWNASAFKIIEAPADAYPSDALANRQQGSTGLVVLIDENGNVLRASVQQTSGVPVLDEASLTLVHNRLRFAAATVDGEPLKCFFWVVVNWTLPPPPPKQPHDKPI
jgi:TonB family protein